MKKTFTFFAAIVIITTAAVAQNNGNYQRDNNYGNQNPGREDAYDVTLNENPRRGSGYDDRGGRGQYFSEREKNMKIAEINNEYFHKIQSIKNRFFMGRRQKERIITELQFQRDDEVRSVLIRFNHRDNRYNQRDSRYSNHDRRNW